MWTREELVKFWKVRVRVEGLAHLLLTGNSVCVVAELSTAKCHLV